MTGERLRRIERVLDARKRVADRLEVELAELIRASMDAAAAAKRAYAAWYAAMDVERVDRCGGDLVCESV